MGGSKNKRSVTSLSHLGAVDFGKCIIYAALRVIALKELFFQLSKPCINIQTYNSCNTFGQGESDIVSGVFWMTTMVVQKIELNFVQS